MAREAKPVEFQAMIDGGRIFIDGLKQFKLVDRVGNSTVAKLTSLLDVFQKECNKMAVKEANREMARDMAESEVQYYAKRKGL